ncbi:hypothetical protein BU16DRAFT_613469 [Lophium mytilinum]|uniref:Uncharacterized protein n=1 Tax=Lophium mytilinum TaxID=390894 RepID=A0A6A6RB63_9PEZI|nr:hypothetical protein BU16DRAFT_613469 [Lophium mytilinum]
MPGYRGRQKPRGYSFMTVLMCFLFAQVVTSNILPRQLKSEYSQPVQGPSSSSTSSSKATSSSSETSSSSSRVASSLSRAASSLARTALSFSMATSIAESTGLTSTITSVTSTSGPEPTSSGTGKVEDSEYKYRCNDLGPDCARGHYDKMWWLFVMNEANPTTGRNWTDEYLVGFDMAAADLTNRKIHRNEDQSLAYREGVFEANSTFHGNFSAFPDPRNYARNKGVAKKSDAYQRGFWDFLANSIVEASIKSMPRLGRGPGCGWGQFSKEAWNESGGYHWLEEKIEEFAAIRAADPDLEARFIYWLREKYMPDASTEEWSCDLTKQCKAPMCDDIKGFDMDDDDLRKAFYFFTWFAYYTARIEFTVDHVDKAWNYWDAQSKDFVARFTSTEEQVEAKFLSNRQKKIAMQIIFSGVAIAGAITGWGAAALVPFAESGGLGLSGPLSNALSKVGVKVTSEVVRDSAQAARAFFSGMGSVAAAGTGIQSILMEGISNLLHDTEGELEKYISNIGKVLNRMITDAGEEMLMTGKGLADEIKTGLYFSSPPDQASKIQDHVERFFRGLAINWAWRREGVYIVVSDAIPNCEDDQRGSTGPDDEGTLSTKVCLPEYPNLHFRFYWIRWQDTKERTVEPPPGWELLAHKGFEDEDGGHDEHSNRTDITPEAIARESYFHYREVGFREVPLESTVNKTDGWADQAFAAISGQSGVGITAGFMFNIPIARSPGGDVLVWNTRQSKFQNYPCRTGEIDITNDHKPPNNLALDPEDSDEFIQAVGYYERKNFWKHCREVMNCNQDKDTGKRKFIDSEGKTWTVPREHDYERTDPEESTRFIQAVGHVEREGFWRHCEKEKKCKKSEREKTFTDQDGRPSKNPPQGNEHCAVF